MERKFSGYATSIKIWLFVGLLMVFIQIVVGGITRLTESGLSITKWDVIAGTIPPVSEADWNKEFELYKLTPQFTEINEAMTLSEFKFIYFWEYIHRFWARIMGFVFIVPFAFFLLKNKLDVFLLRRLGTVFLLACLAATFGWIMVVSGLINRPWVNAYKLSFHLCIALLVFTYLLLTWFSTLRLKVLIFAERTNLRPMLIIFLIFLWIQLFLGGIMSGMKAAVAYPEWPLMGGELFPSLLKESKEWSVTNLIEYDQNLFMATIVQFMHRLTAYTLLFFGAFLGHRMSRVAMLKEYRYALYLFGTILLLQVFLGILTVINSVGEVPVLFGVLHQACAVFLLSITYFIYYVTPRKN